MDSREPGIQGRHYQPRYNFDANRGPQRKHRRRRRQGQVQGPGQGGVPSSLPTVKVGVVVRYNDGALNTGRFQWPVNMTEKNALEVVLSQLPDEDLDTAVEIQFSQTSRNPNQRLKWMDDVPMGLYKINQDLNTYSTQSML